MQEGVMPNRHEPYHLFLYGGCTILEDTTTASILTEKDVFTTGRRCSDAFSYKDLVIRNGFDRFASVHQS